MVLIYWGNRGSHCRNINKKYTIEISQEEFPEEFLQITQQ
jgi:hypothetical protein